MQALVIDGNKEPKCAFRGRAGLIHLSLSFGLVNHFTKNNFMALVRAYISFSATVQSPGLLGHKQSALLDCLPLAAWPVTG